MGAAGTLLARRPRGPGYAPALDALKAVARACAAEGKPPGGLTLCAAWGRYARELRPVLKRYRPDEPPRRGPVVDHLLAAVSLLDSPDAMERSAALAVLTIGLRRLRAAPTPGDEAWGQALADRFKAADDAGERRDLLQLLANHPSAAVYPLFVETVRDSDPRIRAAAVAALERCPPAACPVPPAVVTAALNQERDPVVKNGLLRLAGRLGLPQLVEWCRGALAGGDIARGCRDGLERLQTEAAFNLLYPWIEGESVTTGSYAFREAFAHLNAYADRPYAKARYYALIDRVLGQEARDGHATGIIARQLARLADKPRALEIAWKHYARYRIRFKDSDDSGRRFMLDELRKAVESLEAEAPTK